MDYCKTGVVTRSIQTAVSTSLSDAVNVEPHTICFIDVNTGKLHGWGTEIPPKWKDKSAQELFTEHLCVFGILMQPYRNNASRCVGVAQMANVNVSSVSRHYLADLVLGKEIWVGELSSDTHLTFKLSTAPLIGESNFADLYARTRVGMVLKRIAGPVGKTIGFHVLCRCCCTFNDIIHIDKRASNIEEEDPLDSPSSGDSASGLFSSSAETGHESAPSEDGW